MKSYFVKKDLVKRILEDFPGIGLKSDNELFMHEEYVKKFKAGEKTATARYKKGAIRYPSKRKLPLIQTQPDNEEKKDIGEILVHAITIKRIKDLTDKDGVNNGFENKEELISVMEGIYGKIGKKELISIYHLC